MSGSRPINDLFGWILHRLTANYWSLALGAVVIAPLVFAATLSLDRDGGTEWLLERGLSPVSSAETARDAASVIAGIDTAYLTLYLSISMVVLTIAAGNLGVRLIDRWLAKRLVRVSIAGLSFTVVHAVLTMSAIDADAAMADVPLLTFSTAILLLMINTIMLAVAAHDLGRSMFIDKAIDAISEDGQCNQLSLSGSEERFPDLSFTVVSRRNGYVEGVKLQRIADGLEGCGKVQLEVAPGQHVLQGQTLLRHERSCDNERDLLHAIPIGPFRSNSQGSVFQIRLLVEIAARALSPAINDFYTGLVAVDALVEVAAAHCENWVNDGQVPVSAEHPQIALPGQDFRGLFEDPLAALRLAASRYPAISIRIINKMKMLVALHCKDKPGLTAFLARYVAEVHEHAMKETSIDKDRRSLDEALAEFRTVAEKA